jgi:anti-anti-sigma factor
MEISLAALASGAPCVVLQGRLDTPGVDRIEGSFSAAVANAARSVAVDLTAVSFLSSMGVRMIIAAAKTQRASGRKLVMFGAQPIVLQTLKMVGLDQIIPIAPDSDQAQALLGA